MHNPPTVPVWDILVRLFHWSLVASFIVAYLTNEEDNPWHIYSGYLVLGLIVFRLIWGFVGSKYARFSNFVCAPATVIDYIQRARADQAPHYLGHNPLGGWMILALLASLLVVTLSGLKVYEIEEDKEAAVASSTHFSLITAAKAEQEGTGEADDNEEEFWEEIHEVSSNFMLFLIVLHIVGVVLSSRLHKENLVIAMLTGKKRQS
jgi:cytochrome b